MRTFSDTRGRSWFDIISESPGQVDITVNYPGTIRAFHWHDKKQEWMFVASGNFRFVLTDPDEVIYASQGDCVYIKPHRWHGYQNIGVGEGIVMEYGDYKHDLLNPDDQHKPFNEFHDWEKEYK